MREIKFRAWDKENKEMKIVTELDFLFLGKQNNHHAYQGKVSDVWLNNEDVSYIPIDVQLMQYTGLKDKNDKEIYEEDIVEDLYGKRYKVIYDKYMFNLENYYNSSNDYPCDAFSEGSFVMIGNTYENPELLELK